MPCESDYRMLIAPLRRSTAIRVYRNKRWDSAGGSCGQINNRSVTWWMELTRASSSSWFYVDVFTQADREQHIWRAPLFTIRTRILVNTQQGKCWNKLGSKKNPNPYHQYQLLFLSFLKARPRAKLRQEKDEKRRERAWGGIREREGRNGKRWEERREGWEGIGKVAPQLSRIPGSASRHDSRPKLVISVTMATQ